MPILTGYSTNTGAITSVAYGYRIYVPVPHLLLAAWVYTQNVITTGVLEVLLKKADPMDPRGGSDVSEKIENDDVTPRTSINVRYDFVLLDAAKEPAPGRRTYFVSALGTNSADRFDEPLLIVEYKAI